MSTLDSFSCCNPTSLVERQVLPTRFKPQWLHWVLSHMLIPCHSSQQRVGAGNWVAKDLLEVNMFVHPGPVAEPGTGVPCKAEGQRVRRGENTEGAGRRLPSSLRRNPGILSTCGGHGGQRPLCCAGLGVRQKRVLFQQESYLAFN